MLRGARDGAGRRIEDTRKKSRMRRHNQRKVTHADTDADATAMMMGARLLVWAGVAIAMKYEMPSKCPSRRTSDGGSLGT